MRFRDLTPTQHQAMTRMVGWASDGIPIGALEDSLPPALIEAVVELEGLGLARVEAGWRGTRWWHLTERGQFVRDRGEG